MSKITHKQRRPDEPIRLLGYDIADEEYSGGEEARRGRRQGALEGWADGRAVAQPVIYEETLNQPADKLRIVKRGGRMGELLLLLLLYEVPFFFFVWRNCNESFCYE